MKKNILIALALLAIVSCKKKEDTKEETPAPVVTPGHANVMTARVNGTSWAVTGNSSSTAKIDVGATTSTPKQYVFTGRTDASMYKNAIWIYTPFTTGTVDLRTSPGCSALYFDATGQSYYVKNGSMTITAMDTSHVKSSSCDKFKASFSFTTDSVGGKGFIIDQGTIDFEAP